MNISISNEYIRSVGMIGPNQLIKVTVIPGIHGEYVPVVFGGRNEVELTYEIHDADATHLSIRNTVDRPLLYAVFAVPSHRVDQVQNALFDFNKLKSTAQSANWDNIIKSALTAIAKNLQAHQPPATDTDKS